MYLVEYASRYELGISFSDHREIIILLNKELAIYLDIYQFRFSMIIPSL